MTIVSEPRGYVTPIGEIEYCLYETLSDMYPFPDDIETRGIEAFKEQWLNDLVEDTCQLTCEHYEVEPDTGWHGCLFIDYETPPCAAVIIEQAKDLLPDLIDEIEERERGLRR